MSWSSLNSTQGLCKEAGGNNWCRLKKKSHYGVVEEAAVLAASNFDRSVSSALKNSYFRQIHRSRGEFLTGSSSEEPVADLCTSENTNGELNLVHTKHVYVLNQQGCIEQFNMISRVRLKAV